MKFEIQNPQFFHGICNFVEEKDCMMRITVAIERITMVMKMTVTSPFAVGKALK